MVLRQAAGTSRGSTHVRFGTEQNPPVNVCWSTFGLIEDFVLTGKTLMSQSSKRVGD